MPIGEADLFLYAFTPRVTLVHILYERIFVPFSQGAKHCTFARSRIKAHLYTCVHTYIQDRPRE